MAEVFKRPVHRQVLSILRDLDRRFLDRCAAYFGGGTRIVLELGEYRQSKDIDFLCASQSGYRQLRESISNASLGPVATKALAIGRDVRADQYGIRTWLVKAEAKLKFEIVREARISLSGTAVAGIPVQCLDRRHAFAEKFLANADRGLDASTLSRDVIDLAFMVEGWSQGEAGEGCELARSAYGRDIDRKLDAVIAKLRADRKYRSQCIDGMAIEDTKTLSRGLAALARGFVAGSKAVKG